MGGEHVCDFPQKGHFFLPMCGFVKNVRWAKVVKARQKKLIVCHHDGGWGLPKKGLRLHDDDDDRRCVLIGGRPDNETCYGSRDCIITRVNGWGSKGGSPGTIRVQ